MRNWKKMMAAGLAVGLVATISIAGTLAYLTASQDGDAKVTNTFIAAGGGKLIDPTPDPDDPKPEIPGLEEGFYLVEHEATLVDDPENKVTKYAIADDAGYVLSNNYEKLLPGMVLAKDPQLTVNLEKGVDGYIFVKVKNTTSNLTVNIDTANWTEVKGVALETGETLYCYKGAAQTGVDGTELNKVGILKDNEVTVADTLTGNKNTEGNIDMGALEFTAYACQAQGFETPAAAYTACFTNGGN